MVIKAVPSPGGAFLAAALGLSNATVIEADVVYDLDDLATAVTLEALRVDGRALEAPGFYKWASAARARLAGGLCGNQPGLGYRRDEFKI